MSHLIDSKTQCLIHSLKSLKFETFKFYLSIHCSNHAYFVCYTVFSIPNYSAQTIIYLFATQNVMHNVLVFFLHLCCVTVLENIGIIVKQFCASQTDMKSITTIRSQRSSQYFRYALSCNVLVCERDVIFFVESLA